MNHLPPHIAQGRRQLKLMVWAGLAVPIAFFLFSIGGFIIEKYISPSRVQHIGLDIYSEIAFLLGGIICTTAYVGYKMLQAKVWAQTCWSILGALLGIILLMFGIGLLTLTTWGVLSVLIGAYIAFISYWTLYSKKIEAFFEYMKNTDHLALIDEIGTK